MKSVTVLTLVLLGAFLLTYTYPQRPLLTILVDGIEERVPFGSPYPLESVVLTARLVLAAILVTVIPVYGMRMKSLSINRHAVYAVLLVLAAMATGAAVTNFYYLVTPQASAYGFTETTTGRFLQVYYLPAPLPKLMYLLTDILAAGLILVFGLRQDAWDRVAS